MSLQAGVPRASGFGPHHPHVPPQGEHQHPKGNQEKQEGRDGRQAAEEEGMKDTELCNVQIEFSTVIHK